MSTRTRMPTSGLTGQHLRTTGDHPDGAERGPL
jgi:hypothetical protein